MYDVWQVIRKSNGTTFIKVGDTATFQDACDTARRYGPGKYRICRGMRHRILMVPRSLVSA